MYSGSVKRSYDFEGYMETVREWNYEMSAPDQDILNYVHWRNIGYIDPYEYDLFARLAHNENISYEEVKKKACIIHYAGEKPWMAENVHFDIEKLWWDYAKKTEIYWELLEEFRDEMLSNTKLEEYIGSLITKNENCNKELQKMIEINKKLTVMLQK